MEIFDPNERCFVPFVAEERHTIPITEGDRTDVGVQARASKRLQALRIDSGQHIIPHVDFGGPDDAA
ncbi:MAG: hypothetical protein QF815_00285 [Candidatus Peribacteraceae bacterium]|jgi:hypothetical protein|nr:hypothetical protein [Candidatus Peribacteraceae bacterium]